MTSDSSNRNQGSEVDIAALARKYVEERTKRLRPDGIDQYRSLDEMGEEFARDPHADRAFSRAPVRRETDVLIVGGGFAGLLGAANLRKAGISDIVIVDRAADFGGTWYWNRYPGVRCDVESYVYLPLLEETGFIPSEKYARGAEIQEHCQRIARHLNLYDDALLQTGVTSLDWDETKTRWIARTDRGDLLEAQFVLSCTGLFNCPKLPAISGIESFRGHSFHTSRWDYDYTGGNAGGAMPGLAGKRVGVCGACTYEYYLNRTLAIPGFNFEFLVPEDVEIVTYDTDTTALQDLKLGRVDAMVSAVPLLEEAIKKGKEIRLVGDPVFLEPLAVAADKNSSLPVESLVAEIDRIIAEMHADGSLSELSMKWYGVDITKGPGA